MCHVKTSLVFTRLHWALLGLLIENGIFSKYFKNIPYVYIPYVYPVHVAHKLYFMPGGREPSVAVVALSLCCYYYHHYYYYNYYYDYYYYYYYYETGCREPYILYIPYSSQRSLKYRIPPPSRNVHVPGRPLAVQHAFVRTRMCVANIVVGETISETKLSSGYNIQFQTALFMFLEGIYVVHELHL